MGESKDLPQWVFLPIYYLLFIYFNLRGIIRINHNLENFLVMVIKSMPIHLKHWLLSDIQRIFPDDLKYTDSFKEGINNVFPCAYYTWYNWFSNQVSHIKSLLTFLKIFFWLLQRKDEDNTQAITEYQNVGQKKINTCQFIPRPSTDLRDGGDWYNLLQECFEEIFDWICNLVCNFILFY